MIIITDSKEYSETIFTITEKWRTNTTNENLPIINKIIPKLFQTDNLFFAEIESDSLWKYAFIVNHSPISQFTSLIELSKDNPDLPSGILCLANSGDNFKGYRNRSWISLAGNIHLSAYLKPNQIVDHFHIGFTILSAISVIEALDKIIGLEKKASIKWVNDIFIDNRKVAGVLTQTKTLGNEVTDLFIGIGVNVNETPELENDLVIKKATSIKTHINSINHLDISSIFNNLLASLTKNYENLLDGNYNKIIDAYRIRSNVLGKNITVYSDPIKGEPQIINNGKVISIGNNLELFLENNNNPVVKGRIVLG
ncbi:MAG: biotin--[acetyl-CoA-carboxylase] ligase [Bacteroidetes bacterium]|nr:biotin--[acetyl-CoA-carboxylase] ligase [Bacteroidota bacterium]MBU1115194.1 biotin--[acetyl-CoA-carboxylase] ligase [Bacteroidota bacterium]MBU1799286.1 biotin--[acetyl-CoA-carboxylase] ligase [Bacteroidota bacterium]